MRCHINLSRMFAQYTEHTPSFPESDMRLVIEEMLGFNLAACSGYPGANAPQDDAAASG